MKEKVWMWMIFIMFLLWFFKARGSPDPLVQKIQNGRLEQLQGTPRSQFECPQQI